MWIITEKGFISAVEYREKKDRTSQLPTSLQPPAEFAEVLAIGATRNMRRAYNARKRAHEAHMDEYQELTQDGFILARARVHDDLEQLRPYFSSLEIKEDKGADYKFRAVLPRQAFADAVADAAWDINYDSHFKEVAKERSPKDPERYSAMMACWTALNRMGNPPKPIYKGKGVGTGSGSGSYSGHYENGRWVPGLPSSGARTTPPVHARDYDWEKKFREETGQRPFGSGAAQPLDNKTTEELLQEFEQAHSQTDAELGGMTRQRNDSVDTLDGMIAALLELEYEDIDADMFVPNAPYTLYVVVGELMQETQTQVTKGQVIEALTELLTGPNEDQADADEWQEALDRLEGVDEANQAGSEELVELDVQPAPVQVTAPAGQTMSLCEAAGRHLSYKKHTPDECWAEQRKEREAQTEDSKPEEAEVSQ